MNITEEFMNANFEGSILIFVVIILRSLFLNRIPKKMFILFWEIVLLRFIFIFEFAFLNFNPISIPPVFYYAENWDYNLIFTKRSNNIHCVNLLFFIWLTGALFLLGFVIYTHLKSRKHYSEALPACSLLVNKILVENNLNKKVQVKKLDTISSPFVYGFIKPTIVFPLNIDLDCDTTKYILTHEIMHIKNRDIWKKLFLTVIVSLYWFNPIVWIMFILMNRDIELVCDEAVIKKYGSCHNYIYANLLLSLEKNKVGFCPSFIGIGKNSIKERIEIIMRKNKKSVFCIAISIIIIIIAVSITFGNRIKSCAQDVKTNNNITFSKEELELNEKINQSINASTKENFYIYEKFGLSYDSKTDQLYLNDEPIKYFEDNIADDGSFMGNQYHCERGTDGAYVVHNEKEEIQGIKKFTEKELKEHLGKNWKK